MCPELVVVPAGNFTMGSLPDELGRNAYNEDQVPVTTKSFAVGRFAVTGAEFASFVSATGHQFDKHCLFWNGDGWSENQYSWVSHRNRLPAVCVNWYDAKAYVEWLARTTGKSYRLLSETEREYVARAGTRLLS